MTKKTSPLLPVPFLSYHIFIREMLVFYKDNYRNRTLHDKKIEKRRKILTYYFFAFCCASFLSLHIRLKHMKTHYAKNTLRKRKKKILGPRSFV